MFKYLWQLDDLKSIPNRGLKVFSCFSGGGGSSFGYKMSGADIVGFCECDNFMSQSYLNNMDVKYPFEMPIQELLKKKLPREMYNLDILDGSPPCTNFSKANTHGEKNTLKKHKEGGIVQHLESLPMLFTSLVDKLMPMSVIIENVPQIFSKENALKVTMPQIVSPLNKMGYFVSLFVLNSKYMGIPQSRKRAFVIATRKRPICRLDLKFEDKIIPIKEIKNLYEKKYQYINGKIGEFQKLVQPNREIPDLTGKRSLFNYRCDGEDRPFRTITANCLNFPERKEYDFSIPGLLQGQSFPVDYKFLPGTAKQKKKYLIGMSVPPLMIHRIVERMIKQRWV